MTVYIDVLVILNLYITFFVVKAAARLTHTELKTHRAAAASVFGGFAALLSLADVGTAASLLIKVLVITAAAAMAFGFGKQLILQSFLCLVISLVLSGTVTMLHELLGTDFLFSLNGSVYMNVSALMLVMSTAAVYGIMTLIRRRLDSAACDETAVLLIEKNGISAEISAFPDSGNVLYDFLSGTPVILCRRSCIEKILPENIKQYLSDGESDMHGIRVLPIRTASGTGTVAAFRPDRITAEYRGQKKDISALIGISAVYDGQFEALINPKLL